MNEHFSAVFAPPSKGTARVLLSTKDPVMAQAVNHLVAAVRELQVLVAELQQAVVDLRTATRPPA